MSPLPLAPPAELLALLQARASFVLAIHKGPDGDAMGSALALAHALDQQGKQVQIVAPTTLARHYQWLPGAERLRQDVSGSPEVVLYLDCDGADRVGELRETLELIPHAVQIDHHSGGGFTQVRYLDSSAAATAVLVWRLLQALQWPLTPEIATCLYTGMATDTGFFRFENTGTEVLEAAARMVAHGVVPAQVAEKVSEAQPVNRLRLAGRALASLQSALDGRFVWAVLRPEDYTATSTAVGDTEGIIDTLKQAEGQAVCALLKAPESEEQWQVSLRSPVVDVATVARQFGGGGHARAAGFDAPGPLDEVLARLKDALTTALAALEPEP